MELIKILEDLIINNRAANIHNLELTIPKDKFEEYFGGSYSYIQSVIAPLCNQYGLEATIIGCYRYVTLKINPDYSRIIRVVKNKASDEEQKLIY